MDNNPVKFLSTFAGSLPIDNISPFDEKVNQKTDIVCSSVVKQYNKHMGGSDLLDNLIEKYINKCDRKSITFMFPIIYWMLLK